MRVFYRLRRIIVHALRLEVGYWLASVMDLFTALIKHKLGDNYGVVMIVLSCSYIAPQTYAVWTVRSSIRSITKCCHD